MIGLWIAPQSCLRNDLAYCDSVISRAEHLNGRMPHARMLHTNAKGAGDNP
jgi:hypothetical protein